MPVSDYFDHNEVQQRLAALRQRQVELDDYPRDISPEQAEREQWQAESNAWAEHHPLYAAARSAAVWRPIIPLEPGGTRPLAHPADATNDQGIILEWWRAQPDANIGAVVGRPFLIAMHLDDLQAQANLRALRAVHYHDEDTGNEWTDYEPMDKAVLNFQRQGPRFRVTTDWGKKSGRRWGEAQRADSPPYEAWFVWSYPEEVHNDAFDFRGRRIVQGVEMLSPGTVIPWVGSRFEGRVTLNGPGGPLPTIPLWLARKIGQPRSRKVMQAQLEGYHAARALEGRWPTQGWEQAIIIERAKHAMKELEAPKK